MNSTFCKVIVSVMLAALMVCTAIPVLAKVTPEEAAKLKTELTPMGSEQAGNKEGTIPPWTGGLSKIPENVSYDPASKEFRPDPFAEDKILFTITAQNVDQYKDKLCPGLLRMFELYPDTWKMHIYPTRRSGAYSEEIYQSTYDNALTAEMVDRDGSMANYWKGFVFPIPQNGAEAISNFLNRPNGAANRTGITVGGVKLADGSFAVHNTVLQRNCYISESVPKEEFDPKDYVMGMIASFESAGRKGEIYLMLFRGDFERGENVSWSYIPGMRRVRLNPNSFYDGIDSSQGGLATNDDSWMYNGKIDRFDWKLNEKKEMYVPYNCYAWDLERNKDLAMPGKHPNPELVRWELHRTWEVVATRREGVRHIYGKRVFYLDEDTWQILLRDQYDNHGVLWRFAFATGKEFYDVPTYIQTHYPQFDFQVEGYTTGYYLKPVNFDKIPVSDFSAQYLRIMGKQ